MESIQEKKVKWKCDNSEESAGRRKWYRQESVLWRKVVEEEGRERKKKKKVSHIQGESSREKIAERETESETE